MKMKQSRLSMNLIASLQSPKTPLQKILHWIIHEFILFLIGGTIYFCMEIFARGFSHWTMFTAGGLSFILIGLLNEWYSWDLYIEIQTVFGAIVITALEFIYGYVVNIKCGLNVWDYSDRHFNLFGQICLHHSICYWIPLSFVAILLDDQIRYHLFKQTVPRYKSLLKKVIYYA